MKEKYYREFNVIVHSTLLNRRIHIGSDYQNLGASPRYAAYSFTWIGSGMDRGVEGSAYGFTERSSARRAGALRNTDITA